MDGSRSPTLADVVDLEVQLHRDAERPPEELHDRDAAIGARIDARALDDRSAVLAWLDAVRSDDSIGRRIARWRDSLSAALAIAGFVFGLFSIVGWLATSGREPVNVIYFWPVFIGSQMLLALLWWVVIIPTRRIEGVPIVGPIHGLLRELSEWIPRVFARLLRRLPSGPTDDLALATGELRRLDWIYGRLRFWQASSLTQVFGVAFNVGAICAFVVLPTIDDPAFGWRSRLLDDAQVITTSRIVAAPFAWVAPDALPDADAIEATRYSSVAVRHGDAYEGGAIGGRGPQHGSGRAEPPWAAWWPFLLASLIVYGLLPRVTYLVAARIAARRALATLSFDRIEIARLGDRLRRHLVATRALEPESVRPDVAANLEAPGSARPTFERARALRWVGVDLDEEALGAALGARFGATLTTLASVGDIDPSADQRALEDLAATPEGEAVLVVVEAWEPPVGDYVDFLKSARKAVGDARPIVVVLFNRGRDGAAASPQARHLQVWERRIARLGDPWLSVAPLVGDEASRRHDAVAAEAGAES